LVYGGAVTVTTTVSSIRAILRPGWQPRVPRPSPTIQLREFRLLLRIGWDFKCGRKRAKGAGAMLRNSYLMKTENDRNHRPILKPPGDST